MDRGTLNPKMDAWNPEEAARKAGSCTGTTALLGLLKLFGIAALKTLSLQA